MGGSKLTSSRANPALRPQEVGHVRNDSTDALHLFLSIALTERVVFVDRAGLLCGFRPHSRGETIKEPSDRSTDVHFSALVLQG